MAFPSIPPESAISCEKCLLAHALNNTLAVIIGECQLAELCVEPESECARRLREILHAARLMADRINSHRCQILNSLPSPDHETHP
jgi:hypothetical protein